MKRKENAEKMSRTALIREVRKLRAETKKQAEEIQDYKAEIKRRDNATEHFRKIEPKKIYLAFLLMPLYLAEERAIEKDKDRADKWERYHETYKELTREDPSQFWEGIQYEQTIKAIEQMKKADSNERAKAYISQKAKELEEE